MRLARLNPGFVALPAVGSLSKGVHDGKTLLFTSLTGHTITLPPATGSGTRLRFITRTAATSGSNVVKAQNSTDVMIGSLDVSIAAGGALSSFQAAAASDTITMNRTTTGGAVAGDVIEMEDVASGVWAVRGVLTGTAAPATPFSSGV